MKISVFHFFKTPFLRGYCQKHPKNTFFVKNVEKSENICFFVSVASKLTKNSFFTKHCCGEPGHLKREMFVRYTEINATFKGEITFSHF